MFNWLTKLAHKKDITKLERLLCRCDNYTPIESLLWSGTYFELESFIDKHKIFVTGLRASGYKNLDHSGCTFEKCALLEG